MVPEHSLGSFDGSSSSFIPHHLAQNFLPGMIVSFKVGYFTTFTIPSVSFSSSSEHVTPHVQKPSMIPYYLYFSSLWLFSMYVYCSQT